MTVGRISVTESILSEGEGDSKGEEMEGRIGARWFELPK